MAEIILPKEGETLKINKNEGVSYAILRKVLKDGETMSKSDLEKEFLKLDKASRTELVKLSNQIDYALKKPILEGTEFKIPGFKETEKNSDKIKLIVKEKEGLSHTVLRAKLGEQANSMSTSDLEKYFLSLDKKLKNNFLKNLKDLEKEIKGPLIAGASFQVSLEKFDIGNISPKKVEEKQPEQKSNSKQEETKQEDKDKKTEESKKQEKINNSELLAKRNEVAKQVENVEKLENDLEKKKSDLEKQDAKIEELETKLSNLQQTESKEQNPKENKTPEKTDENLKKGQEMVAEFNKEYDLNVSVDFEKFPYRENKKGLNGNFTVIYREDIDYYDLYYYTIYSGEFKDGLFEGKGIITWPTGDKYDGEWKNDKREGKGIFTSNWAKYDGEWKNDDKEGKGILTYPNGDFIEGIFKEGKIYTGVFNINWGFDKYYVEGKEVSKSEYENYNKQ